MDSADDALAPVGAEPPPTLSGRAIPPRPRKKGRKR
jgi:hypothetical protein